MNIEIRKYKPSDKEAVRNICRITANGRYSATEKGMWAVTLLYNDYYTENEDENIFVAVDEMDTPIGYILCSFGEEKFCKAMMGKYRKAVGKISLSYVPDALLQVLTIRLLPKKYHTHLHIDILPEYQRMGIGTRLMDALRKHLASVGKPFLSVASIGRSTLGYKFYMAYGFREVKSFGFGEVAVAIATQTKRMKADK